MELMIMILVFSLASALCVRMFVSADLRSQKNEETDRAVFEVQNTAEIIKFCSGDLEEAAGLLNGSLEDDVLCVNYDSQWNVNDAEETASYRITAVLEDTKQELLGISSVAAETAEGEELFRLRVAWQEVKANEQR